MTRLIYDEFAKDYLSELLSPIGTVTPSRDVNSEVREIDVYFTPGTATADYVETRGILGKMATTRALFEPFRNPVSVSEVRSCVSKLLIVLSELQLARICPSGLNATELTLSESPERVQISLPVFTCHSLIVLS
ncbi:hypothetical protein MiSe_65650 [Microseira wollei NIES-4236]|uniref:Uncharacterized protein n=1 Tax=Microseira wollei NIES-4236 TaxID=2530354 RepID=A0AAV3XJH7_9CYAN|nr:hypothetical protein MiSe_65650 [Microseira wollei NIES-4236]